jgi:hypothetical protein
LSSFPYFLLYLSHFHTIRLARPIPFLVLLRAYRHSLWLISSSKASSQSGGWSSELSRKKGKGRSEEGICGSHNLQCNKTLAEFVAYNLQPLARTYDRMCSVSVPLKLLNTTVAW